MSFQGQQAEPEYEWQRHVQFQTSSALLLQIRDIGVEIRNRKPGCVVTLLLCEGLLQEISELVRTDYEGTGAERLPSGDFYISEIYGIDMWVSEVYPKTGLFFYCGHKLVGILDARTLKFRDLWDVWEPVFGQIWQ